MRRENGHIWKDYRFFKNKNLGLKTTETKQRRQIYKYLLFVAAKSWLILWPQGLHPAACNQSDVDTEFIMFTVCTHRDWKNARKE